MTINLSRVLLLHAKDNLTRDDPLVGILEMKIRVQRKTRRVFKHMSSHWPTFHHVGHGA